MSLIINCDKCNGEMTNEMIADLSALGISSKDAEKFFAAMDVIGIPSIARICSKCRD